MVKAKSATEDGRPAKRARLLMGDDDASTDEGEQITLKVNEEYARRFEHNKKREEIQRLEEKYGKNANDVSGSDEESSSDESEDDQGMLATVDLDAEISATLNAIRSKDPRVYDKDFKFYSEFDPDKLQNGNEKKEKPMYLRDYHSKNYLEGKVGADEDEEEAPPKTYAQEQQALKDELVKSMHAAGEDTDEAASDEDDFLVKKEKQEYSEVADEPKKPKVELDIASADKDPENFLSNFLAARAWASADQRFAPLESDDEEDEHRADEFEHAYNMRFEDPATANEKLMTHARDAAAKYSVRREELSGRKKQREKERQKKEAEKAQREEEKARLRKLKIEEMEEKVGKIKEAAGVKGKDFNMEEWAGVLEEDWDDDRWDEEMRKRFGEDYYAEDDLEEASSDEEQETKKKKKKPKKPKWDDDIDIKDIVSDFEDDEANPAFTLSDEEEGGVELPDGEAGSDEEDISSGKKKNSKKARKEAAIDAKRAARRERRLIETLVDQNLDVTMAEKQASKAPTQFRYRETSPTTFGLTARDILLADDTQLNQFAGLKKLAAWRDPEKKRKDKKNLGKKARLRTWRKETFGDEDGPKGGFADYVLGKYGEKGLPVDGADVQMKDAGEDGVDIREGGKKKKKRSRKRKADVAEA